MSWRQHLELVGLILVCAVVQTTLTARLWGGAQPDLLLAATGLMGLFFSPVTGSLYACGTGYLQDLLSGGVVGTFMFVRVIVFLLAKRLSKQFYAKSAMAQFVIIVLLAVVDATLAAILTAIFGEGSSLTGSLIWHIPLRAIATALAGLPLYYIIRVISGQTGPHI